MSTETVLCLDNIDLPRRSTAIDNVWMCGQSLLVLYIYGKMCNILFIDMILGRIIDMET
jgi:hypothetical protein